MAAPVGRSLGKMPGFLKCAEDLQTDTLSAKKVKIHQQQNTLLLPKRRLRSYAVLPCGETADKANNPHWQIIPSIKYFAFFEKSFRLCTRLRRTRGE